MATYLSTHTTGIEVIENSVPDHSLTVDAKFHCYIIKDQQIWATHIGKADAVVIILPAIYMTMQIDKHLFQPFTGQ